MGDEGAVLSCRGCDGGRVASAFSPPLILRSELDARGWHSRRIRQEVESGHLLSLRRGVYVSSSDVADLSPEQRIVVRARAYEVVARTPPVFCGVTAAALLGLPVIRDDGRLHVLAGEARPGAGEGVVRHRDIAGYSDAVRVGELLCTPLARTIVDVARHESRDTAVCVADAALRQVAFSPPGTYDIDAAETLRDQAGRVAAATERGRARAERVLALADGRAQLPGESLSRLRLLDLGFASPALQVAVPGPHGSTYWVDFGLNDVDAWGEFDGMTKYRALADAAGEAPRAVVEREKQREDWIRGTTQRRLARWGWHDIRDAATLGRRLAMFGIVPPPRRS